MRGSATELGSEHGEKWVHYRSAWRTDDVGVYKRRRYDNQEIQQAPIALCPRQQGQKGAERTGDYEAEQVPLPLVAGWELSTDASAILGHS